MLLAAVAVLGACGKSDPSEGAARRRPTTASAQQSHASAALAASYARAVNLRGGDVPGFTPSAHSKADSGTEKAIEHDALRCAGFSRERGGLAEESSREYVREAPTSHLSVQSEVSVLATPGQAAGELAKIRSASARGCFEHYLGLLFREQRVRGEAVGPLSISQGIPPAPGTSGGFAWRISTSFSAQGVTIPFSIDVLGFVYGPSEVSLFTAGLPRPFPARAEEQLFDLLLRRALASRP